MTLVEILIQLVGPSIARLILSRWLQTDQIGDVSAPLIDLVKTKTHDIIAQREASRIFEKIGDDVAKNLEPLFSGELSEDSRRAVSSAVGDTLKKVQIDAKVLVSQDLDPNRLSELFLAGYSQTTLGFSDSESELYHRIIVEVSESIVDISSRLPAFTESTLGEILRRSSELLERVEVILREVHQLRLATSQDNESQKAAEFELAYRRAIIRKLDRLELFGADVSSTSREQSISVAYITLSVALKKEGEIRDVKLRVDELLTLQRRLLILGDAGSGKTTMLQWIAVNAATNAEASKFPQNLRHLNGLIPFFLPLRQFAQGDFPDPENFIRPMASMVAGEMPNGWVHSQLKAGRALILIDGVDEIRPSLRKLAQEWINDLTAQFSQCYYVVTSRPSAVTSGWLRDYGFLPSGLLPMDKQEIGLFMSHWHEAVKSQLRYSEEKAEIDDLREHIVDAVWHNRGLRELATNPLLCAMLCALHRDRRQQLPSDRVELYEACSYMLLERRDFERRVELDEFPELSYTQKKAFLDGLAYWMLKNGWSIVTYDQAVEEFNRKISRLRELPEDLQGKSVLNLFLERSGMLRIPSTDEVSFTHKTFQEFFAARAAINEGDTGLLIQQALNDEWQEVIVLAAGLAPKVTRLSLIEELMKVGDNEEKSAGHYYLLALGCTHSSIEAGLPEHETEKLEEKISSLLPPASQAQAQAIAIAGDAIVPYLNSRNTYSVTELVNSVIALYTIGTKKALRVLKSYVNEKSPLVLEKLLKGREYFDPINYDTEILANCLGQREFESASLDTLEGIQYLKNLHSISATMSSKITDLHPLVELTKLVALDLRGCDQLLDLTPLSVLTNLRELNLSACSEIRNIEPIKSLMNLVRLELTHNIHIRNLDALSGLSNLQTLVISDCPNIDALKELGNCTSLRNLVASSSRIDRAIQISSENKKTTRSLLQKEEELQKRVSFSFLSKLVKLEELDILEFRLADLTPLSSCKSLSILKINLDPVITDIDKLRTLTNLRELVLINCENIKDLSPLRALSKLEKLILLGVDNVEDFSVLEKMPQLKVFNYLALNEDRIPLKYRKKEQTLRFPTWLGRSNRFVNGHFVNLRGILTQPLAQMLFEIGESHSINIPGAYVNTPTTPILADDSVVVNYFDYPSIGAGKTVLLRNFLQHEDPSEMSVRLLLRENISEEEKIEKQMKIIIRARKDNKPKTIVEKLGEELTDFKAIMSKTHDKLIYKTNYKPSSKPTVRDEYPPQQTGKPFEEQPHFQNRAKKRY